MAKKTTEQMDFWKGDFGTAYTDRNPQSVEEDDASYVAGYGISRFTMNNDFLADIDRSSTILEVGANLGLQLEHLRRMGFSNLLGIEVNEHAIQQSKHIHPKANIIPGTAFDLPFKDNRFDLVYTSGVLIHIAPKDLPDAMREIYRVSKRYIWGFEYYAPKPTDIEYRGKKGFLWKRDFAALYRELFPDLKLVRVKRFIAGAGPNEDQMFLLEKTTTHL